MSIEVWLTIAIAVVSPAASWLIQARMFEAKTLEWRQSVTERLERLEAARADSDLDSFIAMDTRREMDWTQWRHSTDLQVQMIIKAFADWRHNDYAPEARSQSRSIATIEEQMRGFRERIERLERRVFNGQHVERRD